MKDDNFLSRWSRRKLAAKATSEAGHEVPSADVVPAKAGNQSTSTAGATGPAADVVPVQTGTQSPAPLPPVESLTFDSDFTAFMKPDVDPGLRREALKTLLQDPRFNVMDGLDVYIDDYSKPDPIPEGWLERMYQSNRPNMLMEASVSPPAEPRPGEEVTAKDVPEQPVEPPAAVEGSDTPSAQISPPQVGKSPPSPEGDSDVLV